MFSCSRKFSAGSNQKRVFPIYFPFGRGFPETFREMVKTNNFARAAHFSVRFIRRQCTTGTK